MNKLKQIDAELVGIMPAITTAAATNVAASTLTAMTTEAVKPAVSIVNGSTVGSETEESQWQSFIDSVMELYPGESPSVCMGFKDITDKELGWMFDLFLLTDRIGLLARDYDFADKIRCACVRQATFDRRWSTIQVVFPFEIMDWEVFCEW